MAGGGAGELGRGPQTSLCASFALVFPTADVSWRLSLSACIDRRLLNGRVWSIPWRRGVYEAGLLSMGSGCRRLSLSRGGCGGRSLEALGPEPRVAAKGQEPHLLSREAPVLRAGKSQREAGTARDGEARAPARRYRGDSLGAQASPPAPRPFPQWPAGSDPPGTGSYRCWCDEAGPGDGRPCLWVAAAGRAERWPCGEGAAVPLRPPCFPHHPHSRGPPQGAGGAW